MITSKDLMIGDWYAFRGHPYKCTASDIASIAECEEKGAPTDISEIPLTAEILEKNGFSKSRLMGEQRHFTYYLAPSVSLLAIYDADFSLTIGACARYIKYVHQLQHALRLCHVEKEIEL